ncbi:hypothetical protein BGX21_001131 [Mortierella sp. AD011]|nr:hypothetical protein BGX20_000227 [Mortierella sp. AD010]KAF9385173.1 hypothetical protein BGX21_001131 [Mortierella sp. AD011]
MASAEVVVKGTVPYVARSVRKNMSKLKFSPSSADSSISNSLREENDTGAEQPIEEDLEDEDYEENNEPDKNSEEDDSETSNLIALLFPELLTSYSTLPLKSTSLSKTRNFRRQVLNDPLSFSSAKEIRNPKSGQRTDSKKGEQRLHGQESDTLDNSEIEALISTIKPIEHDDCSSWKVEENCIPCLIRMYQRAAIISLRMGELKQSEPADIMVLAGTFAPFNETPLMERVFGKLQLKRIKESLIVDIDKVHIDDHAIQESIRYKMNHNPNAAEDALDQIDDRDVRGLFRDLIRILPRKEVDTSESDLVSNYISPILRNILHKPDEEIRTTFPNTESTTQKSQGLEADKPDFVLKIAKKEIAFGEVTVYDDAILYRLLPKIRGVLVLAEVGSISIPTHVRAIGSLQSSLPVLMWMKIVIFTTAEKTICWMLLQFLSYGTSKTDKNFRSSEWGPEAADAMCNEVRDYPVVRGMKMGDLIDTTPKEVICKVMLEEKLFETWTYGRTVLLGDACHKMNPSGGLGAQTAMGDAVVLANYINTLITVESEEVEKALKAYKNERYPISRDAVKTSASMSNIIKQVCSG